MVSIYGLSGYELPMKECFNLIKQAGFDGVSLWWSGEFGRPDYRDAPGLAANAGLFVENVHAPFEGINNLWLDNLEGKTLTDNFLMNVDDCAEYGIPCMILHLSNGDAPPPFNETGLDRVKAVLEKAERRGVNIAFENLRRVDYLEYVLNRVDSKRAGFCYDSGHHCCWSPNDDLLSKYGSRLTALHLHDNDGRVDKHLLPFDGIIDWRTTMKNIGKTGYAGAVSLEVVNAGREGMPVNEFF